jgi:hypothetical protein
MKLFINHLDIDNVKKYLTQLGLKDFDFSLFVDKIPESHQDLSPINIFVLQEPNEYFNLHNWVIANQELFSVILTWDDKVLNNCPNSMFFPFGNLWMDEELYSKERNKKFEVSHLCGKKLLTYGQSLRHEILARKNEFKIPTNFFSEYGGMSSIREAAEGKEFIYGNSMFGVIIENTSHRGYFTEKILDSFALKTIPLYWGCTSISDFFNDKGIIKFGNVDDLIYICNNLTKQDYHDRLEAIEDNYLRAINFGDYEVRIANQIKEIFKLNKLI